MNAMETSGTGNGEIPHGTSTTGLPRRVASRRDFLLGAAAAGAGVALAGCGSGSGGGGGAGGARDVSVWVWEETSQWQDVVKRAGMHKQFPGVSFQFISLNPDTLEQKAVTALASGITQGLPSIIRIPAAVYRALVNTGALVDTTKLLARYRPDVLTTTWKTLGIDGKFYGVPDDTGYCMFGYRWDFFERAGIGATPAEVAAAIPTWDDLISVARRVKARTGANILELNELEQVGGTGVFTTMVMQGSTGFFDPQGHVIIDSPYHVQCAELYKKLHQSGLTSYITATAQQWDAYKTGAVAAMPYPNWQDFELVAFAPNTAKKWQVVPLPVVASGGKQLATADGCVMVIPAHNPQDEVNLALKVATYMKLNKTASEAHMKVFSGAFESDIPALEGMRGTPSPMLKDQEVYDIWLKEVNKQQPYAISYASVFGVQAGTAVSKAIYDIVHGGAVPAAALKQAADTVRKLQDARGVL